MESSPQFINVDLDIVGAEPLMALVKPLESAGWLCLTHHEQPEGTWLAVLEMSGTRASALDGLRDMIDSLEGVVGRTPESWLACTDRVLHLGFSSGQGGTPRVDRIDTATLTRVVALGLQLKITIYPSMA